MSFDEIPRVAGRELIPRSRFTEFIMPGSGFRVQQVGFEIEGVHVILGFGFSGFNLALLDDSTRAASGADLLCKLPRSKRRGLFYLPLEIRLKF